MRIGVAIHLMECAARCARRSRAMNCNLTVALIELKLMNCLRHELCLSAHWLQFNSWRRRHADEKSWRSQFMMRQHQFIYKNEQSKNRRICFLLLLLFSACYMGLGLAQMHLTSQMRCSHLVEVSNSPLRTSPLLCQ